MDRSSRPARIALRYRSLAFSSIISLCFLLYLPGTALANKSLPDHKNDARAVVDKLVAEDYEGIRANFNGQMKAALSTEKLREVWKSVVEHLGGYKSQGQPHSNMVQGYEVVVIRCQMEQGQIDIEVDYDPEGKIGGLWIRPLQ